MSKAKSPAPAVKAPPPSAPEVFAPAVRDPEPQSRYFRVRESEKMVGKRPEARPYPDALIESGWYPLARTVLDPIREEVKKPVILTPNGGYRAQEHNAAVGGKRNSRHMYGDAADIYVEGMTAAHLHGLILRMWKEGKLKNLGGLGLYPTFVHVDARPHDEGHLAQWGGDKAQEA